MIVRPVRSHGANRLEQCARFLRSEDRSGLVEDQDACILVQRFQDLDALLLSDGELPDSGTWGDGEAVAM